jgi:phosphoenolpyruvate carboxykinase (ATP)
LEVRRFEYRNLSVPLLVEAALRRGEGVLTSTGALAVTTGKYTGRSPRDRYIVDEPGVSEHIDWGPVNRPMAQETFARLLTRVRDHLDAADETYVFDGFVGRDPRHRLPIRVVTDQAWQSLFARGLFLRPEPGELEGFQPALTVMSASGVEADPSKDGTNSEAFIALSFTKRTIIIGATRYAGEIKKSVFSYMNYVLPRRGVLSMHCAANTSEDGRVALFFGLSGTGKTTLSADPRRRLIGDDEHAWTDEGIFNLEGGCYAKCINLSRENEPQIWEALRFGAVLENVVVDSETREPDYDSARLTENTRAGYPVDHIPGAVLSGLADHPEVILFLTADAFGVLPPLARLDPTQAMYYLLSGYTSKLAGTERGVTEPQATFSSCFGAPFLPLPATVYAGLLGDKIARHGAEVYLVNTGWTGGPYGVGRRIGLPYTRNLVSAAVEGSLRGVPFRPEPAFGLLVPESCPGVPPEILLPRNTWADREAYDRAAQELAGRFRENFAGIRNAPPGVEAAGPPL